MNQPRSRGFALILVISLLAIMSMTFLHLARSCRRMVLQTGQLYASNAGLNLTASGLAWVQAHGRPDGPVVLDANTIAGPRAGLQVEPMANGMDGKCLQIYASVEQSGRTSRVRTDLCPGR